jgi:hypothetical protein
MSRIRRWWWRYGNILENMRGPYKSDGVGSAKIIKATLCIGSSNLKENDTKEMPNYI